MRSYAVDGGHRHVGPTSARARMQRLCRSAVRLHRNCAARLCVCFLLARVAWRYLSLVPAPSRESEQAPRLIFYRCFRRRTPSSRRLASSARYGWEACGVAAARECEAPCLFALSTSIAEPSVVKSDGGFPCPLLLAPCTIPFAMVYPSWNTQKIPYTVLPRVVQALLANASK